ncbi:MAG: hypothetical protein H7Y89_13820 [Steroidobacteraceae bacterium]|nr:hypothetical protein [Steroidobacteraceae bacterium]
MKHTRMVFIFVLVAVSAIGSLAKAEVIVQGSTLFDTETNLLWSGVQIPTATFRLDSEAWTIGTLAQFYTLVSHIGPESGPFSQRTQNLSDMLNALASYTYGAAHFEEGALCTGPNAGGNCYAGTFTWYRQEGFSEVWNLSTITTASLYGPTFQAPFPGSPWPTEFVTAFAVTPVPLPPAVLPFALALLVLLKRRRTLGFPTDLAPSARTTHGR